MGPIVLLDKVKELLFDEKGRRRGWVEYEKPKDGKVFIFLALGVAHPSEITPELIQGLVDAYRDSKWTVEKPAEPEPKPHGAEGK
jgi:hypothetical protein